MTKKILMVVHTFPPIGSVGGSIRLVKFLKYINELRSDIHSTVLTLKDDITLLHDFQLSGVSLDELPEQNVKIIRTNTLQPRHPNPNPSIRGETNAESAEKKKLLDIKKWLKNIYVFVEKNFLIPDYAILWYPYSLKSALKEIRYNNIDIIYATAPPYSVIVQASILKKITKKKLVIDIKDDWIYQTKHLAKPYLVRKLEQRLERFCIKNADKVILVTPRSYEDFVNRYSKLKEKFTLITNGCDIAEYERFWDVKHERNKKFTVIHSGVLSNTRNPIGFFNALSELKEVGIISSKNFQMKFIGQLQDDVLNIILEKGLDDIVFSNKVLERDDYIREISTSDLLLAFNYQIKTLIPGKIYDYWGARKPILLIDLADSMAAKSVNENNLGVVKDFEDSEGIKEAVSSYFTLWNNDSLSPESQINIKNLYKYDRKNLTKKLIEIFDSML